jgi:hypothetical protein
MALKKLGDTVAKKQTGKTVKLLETVMGCIYYDPAGTMALLNSNPTNANRWLYCRRCYEACVSICVG